MHELFDDLNKDFLLYKSLIDLKNSIIYSSLPKSQQIFTDSLIKEFEREGTHLEISSTTSHSLNILKLQSQFLLNIDQSKSKLLFSFEEIEDVPSDLRPTRQGAKYDDIIDAEYDKEQLNMIVNFSKNPKIRERAYKASCKVNSKNKEVLKELVNDRRSFANSLGFSNFAEYSMKQMMFQTSVQSLIENLMICHGYLDPKLKNEYDIILDRKALAEQISRNKPVSLEPWDLSYYSARYIEEIKLKQITDFTKHYNDQNFFTLYNILEGMKMLCLSLFKIELEIAIANLEET